MKFTGAGVDTASVNVPKKLVEAGQDLPANGSGRRYLTFVGRTAERPV